MASANQAKLVLIVPKIAALVLIAAMESATPARAKIVLTVRPTALAILLIAVILLLTMLILSAVSLPIRKFPPLISVAAALNSKAIAAAIPVVPPVINV